LSSAGREPRKVRMIADETVIFRMARRVEVVRLMVLPCSVARRKHAEAARLLA
jgi:hypothetical protein